MAKKGKHQPYTTTSILIMLYFKQVCIRNKRVCWPWGWVTWAILIKLAHWLSIVACKSFSLVQVPCPFFPKNFKWLGKVKHINSWPKVTLFFRKREKLAVFLVASCGISYEGRPLCWHDTLNVWVMLPARLEQ